MWKSFSLFRLGVLVNKKALKKLRKKCFMGTIESQPHTDMQREPKENPKRGTTKKNN